MIIGLSYINAIPFLTRGNTGGEESRNQVFFWILAGELESEILERVPIAFLSVTQSDYTLDDYRANVSSNTTEGIEKWKMLALMNILLFLGSEFLTLIITHFEMRKTTGPSIQRMLSTSEFQRRKRSNVITLAGTLQSVSLTD